MRKILRRNPIIHLALGGGEAGNAKTRYLCSMHTVKRSECLTVFYRAMYLGIDLNQSGATRFSSFFLEDEEYVSLKKTEQNQISLFNGGYGTSDKILVDEDKEDQMAVINS